MALFEVIKPFRGEEEKRDFLIVGEEVEMTVARAEKIQKNINASHPEYGDVLRRKDAPESKASKTDEVKSESAKK